MKTEKYGGFFILFLFINRGGSLYHGKSGESVQRQTSWVFAFLYMSNAFNTLNEMLLSYIYQKEQIEIQPIIIG